MHKVFTVGWRPTSALVGLQPTGTDPWAVCVLAIPGTPALAAADPYSVRRPYLTYVSDDDAKPSRGQRRRTSLDQLHDILIGTQAEHHAAGGATSIQTAISAAYPLLFIDQVQTLISETMLVCVRSAPIRPFPPVLRSLLLFKCLSRLSHCSMLPRPMMPAFERPRLWQRE